MSIITWNDLWLIKENLETSSVLNGKKTVVVSDAVVFVYCQLRWKISLVKVIFSCHMLFETYLVLDQGMAN